jgi:4'-phosphopantetheinyl transferase
MGESKPHGSWRPAPLHLSLSSDETHLWRAPLTVPPGVLERRRRTLSEEERERADRYHLARDRDHFIAARGGLRELLGLYLQLPPAQVSFTYGAHGKPALLGGHLQFSVSHAHELALFALTERRPVGVDLEWMRVDLELEEMAERFFSLNERRTIRSLPAAERPAAFFACWTRKEAYVKAVGIGLSLPLDRFDVACAPTEPAALRWTDGDPDGPQRWAMHALHPGRGYIGALVTAAPMGRILLHQLPT